MNTAKPTETLRVIDASLVRDLLPMHACIDVMADAMRAATSGELAIPPRTHLPLADDSAAMLLMPGSSLSPPYYGAKIVSMHGDNPSRGLPAIQGFVALFEHDTGTPVALIDAASVTAIRTAAASALATRELARADASTLGIFGTGVQAAAHIEAIACVRDINTVYIWGRDQNKTVQFAATQSRRYDFEITACGDAREAAACDIVTTVTGASVPVLQGDCLNEGAHVNLVGSHTPGAREADTVAIQRSRVFVDSRDSALREAGDILIPIEEGAVDESAIVAEIGAVIAGDAVGRRTPHDISLYKSLGVFAQDLFAAARVFEAAREADAGTRVGLA